MDSARVNGVTLEYEVRGTGEPVLLVHGSHIARSFLPLVTQRELTERYMLIRYHRRGFLGSSPVQGPVTLAEQAADAVGLLDHLGTRRAHLVGHSYGGSIALQIAADFPDRVHSLVLLEAALLSVPLGKTVVDLVSAAEERYRAGDWEAAQDLFLGSPEERAVVARHVPGALEQSLRDTDTYFGVEAPAHETWQFGAEEAARITAPTLFVLGERSNELYRECYEQIREWIPQTRSALLEGATHLLHMQQPAGAARILSGFFATVPMLPGRAASSWWSGQTELYNAAVDLLDGNLDRDRGSRPAVRTPSGEWTYAEVAAAANRAGNALIDLGVEPENRVLLALPDGPELVSAFFGALKSGAVPVPVAPTLGADDYAYLLTDTRAKAAVVDASTAVAVREARRRLATRRPCRLAVVGETDLPTDEVDFAEMTSAAADDLAPVDTVGDDMAFWLYSSGTSGRPKAVVHLQDHMRFCADTYARHVLDLTEDDVTFSVSKLHLAYGLGGGLYFPFAVGAATVLLDAPAQPRMVTEVVRRFRPTVLFGVPTGYANFLAAASPSRPVDVAGVRLCVSAGEPLAGSLLRRWKEHTGLDILDGVGSTETCHIFLSNRRDDIRPDCLGTVVDGYDVKIVDDDGRSLAPGHSGALLVRGRSTAPFYWRQAELTRKTMLGEWVRTGDLVVEDESGHFSFRGREDDMLKVGGMWVSPVEIEAVLGQDDRVAECAVVGVPDRDNLVKPEAFVVLDRVAASEGLAVTLRQHVRQRLGGNKTPRTFHFVPELPRTAIGKVQRSVLREQARQAARS